MSPMELLFALMDCGWVEQCVRKSRKLRPFTQQSQKLIFYHAASESGGLHRFYLMALLDSKNIFEKGISEIHYFQSEEYYKTLINCKPSLAGSIMPNRPAAEYKRLKQGQSDADRPFQGRMLLDDDAEGTLVFSLINDNDL